MVIPERMSMDHWWIGNEKRKSKRSEINLSQCHFVSFHIDWLELNMGLRGESPTTRQGSSLL